MSEQMSEEFEALFAEHEWDIEKYDGSYINAYTTAAWLGWQASRQALVVKLPESHTIDGYFYVDLAMLEHSLAAAGVKYE
jgi:hypothetical protein